MNITLPLIIGSATVDSINPCAFAVLIFLILYMMTMKDKRKMLQIGLVYILFVYLVYLAAGIGLLSVISSIHITRFFYSFTAILAIILGLVNLKDSIWPEGKPLLAIPESRKPLMQKYIRQATLPAAVILGVLVALFELPCTGGVYLAILALLAERETWTTAVSYLLFYNIIFVAPLLLILFGVYYGLPPEKVDAWRKEQKRWLRLGIGVFLIILGLSMFFI